MRLAHIEKRELESRFQYLFMFSHLSNMLFLSFHVKLISKIFLESQTL